MRVTLTFEVLLWFPSLLFCSMRLIFEETLKGQPGLFLLLLVAISPGQRKAELYRTSVTNPKEVHDLIWPTPQTAGGKGGEEKGDTS